MEKKIVEQSFLNGKQFGDRLAELRLQKDISARDMSLSMGQNSSYINHIENQRVYPSMESFFYICEFLNISPFEFFNLEINYPIKINKIIKNLAHLSEQDLDFFDSICETMIEK